MHLNPAAVLLAFSSITATYAVPVSPQQGTDESLHRRKVPYSVVDVDGGSQTAYGPVKTTVKTVEATKTVTEPGPRLPPVTVTVQPTSSSSSAQAIASSISPLTPYLPSASIPVAPGSTGVPFWNTNSSTVTVDAPGHKYRRESNLTYHEPAAVRRLARSIQYTNTTGRYGLEARDYNETYSASVPAQNPKRSLGTNETYNSTTIIEVRSSNTTYYPSLSVRDNLNSTAASNLRVRSYNATYNVHTPVQRSVGTGVNRSGIKSSNVTYHMPVPVQALSSASSTAAKTTSVDLPPLPPQPTETPNPRVIPPVRFPQHHNGTL